MNLSKGVVLLALLLIPALMFSEIILLKSGKTTEGEIVDIDGTTIYIALENGLELQIEKVDIERIFKTEGAYNEFMRREGRDKFDEIDNAIVDESDIDYDSYAPQNDNNSASSKTIRIEKDWKDYNYYLNNMRIDGHFDLMEKLAEVPKAKSMYKGYFGGFVAGSVLMGIGIPATFIGLIPIMAGAVILSFVDTYTGIGLVAAGAVLSTLGIIFWIVGGVLRVVMRKLMPTAVDYYNEHIGDTSKRRIDFKMESFAIMEESTNFGMVGIIKL